MTEYINFLKMFKYDNLSIAIFYKHFYGSSWSHVNNRSNETNLVSVNK